MQVDSVLREAYNIKPEYVLDNRLCQYNSNIKSLAFLDSVECNEFDLILAVNTLETYMILKEQAMKYIKEDNIIELDNMRSQSAWFTQLHTTIGRHSNGEMAKQHLYIKSIGNFCSFAIGADVVPNHQLTYLSTHVMLDLGQQVEGADVEYSYYKNRPGKIEGVTPHKNVVKQKRTTIGNDVWLGRNVIIKSGVNIGDGVIAGAGAIITKDVPDYAIVVGVPARIIRYRYTPEQIEALKRIQWWNWSDEEIRDRYDDFYLPIDKFIEKYDTWD